MKAKVLFREENVGQDEWKKIDHYVEQYDKLHEHTGETPFVDTSSKLSLSDFEILRDKVRSAIRAGWQEE